MGYLFPHEVVQTSEKMEDTMSCMGADLDGWEKVLCLVYNHIYVSAP